MYFSLISPAEGREREATHQRLAGPYADHQWLWRWFPAERGAPRDFLFRRHEGSGPPRFYVVSRRAPVSADGCWQVQTRDYAPQLALGDRFQFELRANPTVRHGHDGNSKRHDVVMNAKKKLLAGHGLTHWKDWRAEDRPSLDEVTRLACGDWLTRRAEALGFAPELSTLVVQGQAQHGDGTGRGLQFTTVDLAGELTVVDPSAMQQALLGGIGSAKAFGCGLLLLKRLG